jgi:transcriptional regulator with XRE-family HTH domain
MVPHPPKETLLSKHEIGERLRALRLAREMTQAKVAQILGVPHTNVSAIERGLRGVSLQQLVKLSRALDVQPAEIIGGARTPRRTNGHLPRRFERIRSLPRSKQRVLHELIDAFLEKHGSERG